MGEKRNRSICSQIEFILQIPLENLEKSQTFSYGMPSSIRLTCGFYYLNGRNER